jgi:hypothetical protein
VGEGSVEDEHVRFVHGRHEPRTAVLNQDETEDVKKDHLPHAEEELVHQVHDGHLEPVEPVLAERKRERVLHK